MRNIVILTGFISVLFLLPSCKPGTGAPTVTPDAARQMLQLRGYEVNAKGYFSAIQQNDAIAIRTFFQSDLDPNILNEKGDTPLTYAVVYCDLKTVKALTEKADINMRDKGGNSPLYLALVKARRDVFDSLLKSNADVNVPGNKENTVLHVASTQDDFDLIKKLVERGANVNAVDNMAGSIPLIDACIGRYPHLETVKFFIEHGTNINHQNGQQATCLMYAAGDGHTAVVEELLKAGAKTDLKDKDGHDALWWAQNNKRSDIVKLLRKK